MVEVPRISRDPARAVENELLQTGDLRAQGAESSRQAKIGGLGGELVDLRRGRQRSRLFELRFKFSNLGLERFESFQVDVGAKELGESRDLVRFHDEPGDFGRIEIDVRQRGVERFEEETVNGAARTDLGLPRAFLLFGRKRLLAVGDPLLSDLLDPSGKEVLKRGGFRVFAANAEFGATGPPGGLLTLIAKHISSSGLVLLFGNVDARKRTHYPIISAVFFL